MMRCVLEKKGVEMKRPQCATRAPIFPCLNGKRSFFIAINRAFLMSIAVNDRNSTILYSRAILKLLYGTEDTG